MAQGHHLHLRLFIEGVEVPVISASVQVAANSPAACSIQVVATDKILDLYPRTVVHLFFYDYIEASNPALDTEPDVTRGDEYVDWFNSHYKLLFMGELSTIQFQKDAGQRAVILQCVDFSNYWDTTFQYNFGGSLFGGRRQANFIGANSNFFTSPLGHGTGTISRLLSGRSVNFPDLRGLLAGIVRMLEAIGGSYYGKSTFRGANDFTSIAELRLKILQQITAAPKDTSTAKLFARKTFNMWLNRATQGLGKMVSFRGLIQVMFQFIFHEVYPCPAAKFVPAGKRNEPRNYSVAIGKTGKYKAFAARTQAALISTLFAKSNLVAWRRDSSGFTRNNSFLSASMSIYIKSWAAFDKEISSLLGLGQALNIPSNAMKELTVAHTKAKKIKSLSTNSTGTISANLFAVGSDGNRGSLDRQYPSIIVLYTEIADSLKKILGVRIGRKGSKTVETQARVNNQIFRPDIFFSAPPRCNVLFPESYDTFSFSRQYLREVSRLELQTHNEILGNDALFNGRYYAPNVKDVRKGLKLSSGRFARLILDHELFTGIIPMFENLSEANLFAMRSGAVQKSGAKVGYAQRAVNFQYFKYRFQARSMSAAGRFNPMFVPGFPSLIIDKYMDKDALAISALPVGQQTLELGLKVSPNKVPTLSEVLRTMVSPQYLGVCSGLVHQVSQSGGRTQYQFMHARVHREDTEYLGVDKVPVYKVIPGSGSVTKEVYAAPALTPPKVGSSGPHGGKITAVRDVSKREKGKSLPLLGTGTTAQVGETVPSALWTNNSHLGKDSLIIAAFEVTEGWSRRYRETIDLPIEDAIRPPWIWDGWAVPKISETYEHLFGTTAITDIAGFSVKEGTRSLISEESRKALTAQNATTSSGYMSKKKGVKKSAAASSDPRDVAKTQAGQNQQAILNIEKERTIENSVDFLVRAYSFVKVNNLDVGDFLRAYGWRPIATMVEIMGGNDLKIEKKDIKVRRVVRQKYVVKKQEVIPLLTDPLGPLTTEVKTKPIYGTRMVSRLVSRPGYVVTGREGFHSRAFGDTEDLFGLVSPTVTRVLQLSGSKRKVAAKLDVRKRRRDVVRLYVAELTGSQGLLG